jgi:hypothetical protein
MRPHRKVGRFSDRVGKATVRFTLSLNMYGAIGRTVTRRCHTVSLLQRRRANPTFLPTGARNGGAPLDRLNGALKSWPRHARQRGYVGHIIETPVPPRIRTSPDAFPVGRTAGMIGEVERGWISFESERRSQLIERQSRRLEHEQAFRKTRRPIARYPDPPSRTSARKMLLHLPKAPKPLPCRSDRTDSVAQNGCYRNVASLQPDQDAGERRSSSPQIANRRPHRRRAWPRHGRV